MTTDTDPFEAFAAEMTRAANIEADAGLPLFDPTKSPSANLAAVSTMDEAAEIYLKAEALAKSARIQKKAASTFLAALATNKGLDELETNAYRVTVEREDQLSFDDEQYLADLKVSGKTRPAWLNVEERAKLTPTQLKNLTSQQQAALGQSLQVKGEKISITVERK